jgi:hypothetical protein
MNRMKSYEHSPCTHENIGSKHSNSNSFVFSEEIQQQSQPDEDLQGRLVDEEMFAKSPADWKHDLLRCSLCGVTIV